LDIGPGAFLAQKCLLVGFWLLILVVHKNFRFARMGLYASLAVYVILMLVHFAILALGIEPPSAEELAEAAVEQDHAAAETDPTLAPALPDNSHDRMAVRKADPSTTE
jgi:hypothetical protein